MARSREEILGENDEEFLEVIGRMLREPSFGIPICTAAWSLWDQLHQMTAAAMFEDVWRDALSDYLSQCDGTGGQLVPTQRGAEASKGDYIFKGTPYSHKTSSDCGQLAVLWDARKASKGQKWWRSPTAIVDVVVGNGAKTRAWQGQDEKTMKLYHPWFRRRSVTKDGTKFALISWSRNGDAELLVKFGADMPNPDEFFSEIRSHHKAGRPVSELELFLVPAALENGARGMIDGGSRPGAYLYPKKMLERNEVVSNNRALLFPAWYRKKKQAAASGYGLFSPMPVWPQLYASRDEFRIKPFSLWGNQKEGYSAMLDMLDLG